MHIQPALHRSIAERWEQLNTGMTNSASVCVCVCGSERKEKEEGQGRGKASTANPTLRWLLSQVSCGGWGGGRGGVVVVITLCSFFACCFYSDWEHCCLPVSCSLYQSLFWVFITTTCPTLLSCFCSFLSSLLLLPFCPPSHSPSIPPSLPLPPLPRYRMCVCHVFHQSYGTECNQSHAPVSDYGGMVLLPFLQLSVSLVPLIHALHSVIVLAIICLSHLWVTSSVKAATCYLIG